VAVVVGLLGSATACQAHVLSHSTGESSSSGDDGDPEPDPPVPTSDPDPTAAPTATGEVDTTSGTSGTSDTGDATSTTTDPSGVCGDGVVDAGETCDLGFAGNSDEGSCTQACQTAYCGDGLVWVGEEICDNGANNNDQTYNGCQRACTPGPRCGDGALQIEEECDPSVMQDEVVVSCDPDTCRFNARVAFVTSASFAGNFGGLTGADAACVAAAQTAGLDNASNFMAWVSDGVTGPAKRFTLVPGYPYTRRDGQPIAYDLDTMYEEGLQRPLDITELGTTLPPGEYAWSNTKVNGQPLDPQDHCQAWQSDSSQQLGRAGQVSPLPADFATWIQSAQWTQYTASLCKDSCHLYCFEQ
jgi:hypothetical protein